MLEELKKYAVVHKKIDWYCDWYYAQKSLQDIRAEIDRLESLGVTHIEFDYDADFGESSLSFKAFQIRHETDEEFEIRKRKQLEKIQEEKERQEILDINNYLRLKKKYEGNNGN